MSKPTVLIVTANDIQGNLYQLSNELKEVQRILNSAPGREYEVVPLPDASIDDIIEEFKIPGRSIEIFHYAGHADGEAIHLTDNKAKASDLAEKIRISGTVKLVFLNGCATYGQVQYFRDAGVPFVLATSSKVGDTKAHWLATQFYQYLTLKRSLQKAWEEVILDATKLTKEVSVDSFRNAGFLNETSEKEEFEWGLYSNDNAAGVDYSLPFSIGTQVVAPKLNHTTFLEEMVFALDDDDLKNSSLQKLKNLSTKIKRGSNVPDSRKITELLRVLPYTLGVRLRQITAKPDHLSSEYFRELLYDYVFFFETLLFQTFTLFSAQIWQDKEKAFIKRPKNLGAVQTFLRQNRMVEGPDTYVEAIEVLFDWQASYHSSPAPSTEHSEQAHTKPIDEPNPFLFAQKVLQYLHSEDFKEASTFFFLQKKYFWERIRLKEEETLNNCVLSQQYISKAFPHFNFLVNYVLASVREINIMNFRHLPEDVDQIENMVSKLIVTDAEPDSLSGNDMMENKFILSFYKTKPGIGTTSLNLFPFIIDRNVFTGKPNSEIDLYLFAGFFATPTSGEAYHFVSVENPGKIWRFDPEERKVSLLHTDEATTLIHEQHHLMARAWEFKNYLTEYHSQFLQLLQA